MEKLTIVKVGGKVVEETQSLSHLLRAFFQIEGRRILVHGGGRTATQVAARLGIETQMVNGRRITDAEMLRVVTMVYGGLVNKNIVSQLNALGVKALGLTGADLGIIRSHRRPPLPDGTDYGFVGDIDSVDAEAIRTLLEGNMLPVIAPLSLGADGQLLNTNADTIAASVAEAMAALYNVTLIFCFEHKGVLRNPDDPDSVIPRIDSHSYEQLKADGIVSGGMLPKLDNSFAALRAGVKRVVITRADQITDNTKSTIIQI
ncbi:MAG: acetylglutamate kinase [Bacteroidaceae bacterium]|nr:acetylglutamate kinase [Bacteroidaceae bacterium]